MMKTNTSLLAFSAVAMVGTVLGLRWTHHSVWFFAFMGSMALFVLTFGDFAKARWGLGIKGVSASVHALAALLFTFGMAAGIYGIGNPAYSLMDLAAPPFVMAGCVYGAYFLIQLKRFL